MPGKLGSRWGNKTTHQVFTDSFTINPKTGCWEWFKVKNSNGYGRFKIMGEYVMAHRYSYQYYVGEIEEGLIICHKCDNEKCCSPFHLFKGTTYDNTMDAINKGRRPKAQHGTLTMYCQPNNCRCEPCVKAGYEYYSNRSKSDEQKAKRKEKYQQEKLEKGIPDRYGPTHGNSNTYRKHKCRCELCVAAYRVYCDIQNERERQKRRNK